VVVALFSLLVLSALLYLGAHIALSKWGR
jgi:hypothetical protein